jgi:mono/diheme cytochrome c family protein
MRNLILATTILLFLAGSGPAQQTTISQVPIKSTSWVSGQQMFHEYCAACHGNEGNGQGPARSALTVKPADLTHLAKRHGGKFPYYYFYGVLQFGVYVPAHGSSDMPAWAPLFRSLDEREGLVTQRMHNLAVYVSSLQSTK